jgi:hypothetical protein
MTREPRWHSLRRERVVVAAYRHAEIPALDQHLCDELWAVRGRGANLEHFNHRTGAHRHLACALRAPTACAIATPC